MTKGGISENDPFSMRASSCLPTDDSSAESVAQFYRMAGNSLDVVAGISGYTSRRIGLRNLDMAAAGDFDGDGTIELLLPDDAMRTIGAIRRTAAGAEVAWTLPMGRARVATNLAAVLNQNASAVGVGREDGVLRIWTQS